MTSPASFPVVGIGASAGGLEALEGFFKGLPENPGVAIVVVTHLNPDRDSRLPEVLSRFTSLRVKVAAEGDEILADTVYVMPAGHVLTTSGRAVKLRKTAGRREPKPIDIFFSSLAMEFGELAVAVILSGGDSDGTLGVKTIKERGGLTLAQVANGFGPQHPDMPDAAISAGLIDFAVPAEEMGQKILGYARSLRLFDDSSLPGAPLSEGEESDDSLSEIYSILRNQIGHDFSGYKQRTFARRVQRRVQVAQLGSTAAYLDLLRQQPSEVSALFRDLLINVTNFFRDTEAFEVLASSVIPKLFEGRGAEDTVRIWIPGCATGEEVFSIAILVREHLDQLSAVPKVQIFATDIDERALAVARHARYPEPLLDTVTAERRARFFVADGMSFVVSKQVREMCIFSPHSVIRDPPFSRIDLVSCRNLLIYFGVETQSQVIPTFHYALRPDGYLFLGSAENVTQFGELFVAVDKQHRIFRRRSDISSSVRIPIMLNTLRAGRFGELAPRPAPLSSTSMRQVVDAHIIEHHSPPHVVVNRDGDIVYYSNRTGKYLEAPGGAPTRNLLAVARKSLRLDLRSLFREAIETVRLVSRDGITIDHDDGRAQVLSLTVEPLNKSGFSELMFVVLFIDQGPVLSREEALARASAHREGSVEHVERELREARDRLQSMIEEYETALEELKSSNEELVSVNEELQSTNEELEASKEELQSLNEELHTVNGELGAKIDELDRSNNDLIILFESTEVATIFLDAKLGIRSYTPAVARIFHILPSDRGRPITDLSSRLELPDFSQDISKVFQGLGPFERRVSDHEQNEHYLLRVAAYRDGDRMADGVVLTFVDVTNITLSEARQRLLISELQHRTRNLLAVIQSIGRQTLGQGGNYDDFTQRLGALSRAQGLIGDRSEEGILLRELVNLELRSVGADTARASVTGPDVALTIDVTQAMGLALHELATNAVKYGALRNGSGALEIQWTVSEGHGEEQILSFSWRERGVALQPVTRSGFGRQLIEKALVYTLKAQTVLTFGEDGVSCLIEIPLTGSGASFSPPEIS